MGRPRFRLSTIVWIITVAAILLGWWVDRQQRIPKPPRFQMLTTKAGTFFVDMMTGKVKYVYVIDPASGEVRETEPVAAK
jgi:hypothetical protein